MFGMFQVTFTYLILTYKKEQKMKARIDEDVSK